MKKYVFIIIGISACVLSCNTDDVQNIAVASNYQPLGEGNYWNYDVQGTEISERDSLYVSYDTLVNSKTYKKMRVGNVPTGFFSNTLNKNILRAEGGKVYLSGNTGLSLGDFLPLNVQITDFIILDENASSPSQLSSINGTIEQIVQDLPLKIDYKLTSEAGQTYPTYTIANGTIYNNVKSVKVKLNLKISTIYMLGTIPLSVPVLNTQDVIVSERFYAANIGMVYSTTKISYELQDFSDFNIDIPIPQSGQEIQTEVLNTYNVD